MTDFYIGQLVVCVDDDDHTELQPKGFTGGLGGLKKGTIYTVRWHGFRFKHYRIRVEEIIRRLSPVDGEEYAYFGFRFKPLNEKKTDISIFTRMLKSLSLDTDA